MRFSILLPPSEGKQSGGNPLAPDMFDYRSSNTFNYFSHLNPERRALIDALQTQVREALTSERLASFLPIVSQLNEEYELRTIAAAALQMAYDQTRPSWMRNDGPFAGEEKPRRRTNRRARQRRSPSDVSTS